jgi:hypothetical protein
MEVDLRGRDRLRLLAMPDDPRAKPAAQARGGLGRCAICRSRKLATSEIEADQLAESEAFDQSKRVGDPTGANDVRTARSADASHGGEFRLSSRRINQGRTDALRQGTMRPWKPSPNPAFDLSAGSPRAQASRGFYSFLYGDSVESRRARPFAASGAPCLTLNPTGTRPSSTTTSRPSRSAPTRRSPPVTGSGY